MQEEIQKLALDLRNDIGKFREITDQTSFNEAFILAANIQGTLSYLISPLMLLEQRYRQKVVEFKDKGNSSAAARDLAMAGDEYIEWRKYEMLYELGHQTVLLCKRFKSKLEDEYLRA